MEELEHSVRLVFVQGAAVPPEAKATANAHCEAVKERADGWQLCWALFRRSESLEVRFWCLQAVTRAIPLLPAQARLELRALALAWLSDVAAVGKEDAVIRNKIALVYVGLLRLDYPCLWQTAWADLLALLDRGPPLVDMFLRVLATFDQEVVSDEVPRSAEDRQRSQTIKAAMREGEVLRLAECWYTIVTSFHTTSPQLAVDCLKVVSVFIVWVDVGVVANDKFLDALCGLISAAGPPAGEACVCLAAVIAKKAPAARKMQMLEQFQMVRRLEGCVHRQSSDLLLLEKEAEMLNAVSEVVLEMYAELRVGGMEGMPLAKRAWESLEALMPTVFWCFSHQEYRVAASVEPFLTQFFVQVKAFVKAPDGSAARDAHEQLCHAVALEQMRPILTTTLQLTIQRMAYPDWFQHGDPCFEDDDRHVSFLEFRKNLLRIFKRIFLVDETLAFQFVQASVSQLTQADPKAVQPMEVEAVLCLLREAGEIVRSLQQHLQARGPLAGCFVQLVECEAIVRSEHWAIQLGLLELYIRYGRIFAVHAELFPRLGQRVVEAFVGLQGIRSKDQRVVAKACVLLPRFVKAARQQIAPLAPLIYEACKDLLVVQYVPSQMLSTNQASGGRSMPCEVRQDVLRGVLKPEDQAGLYEALASLISALPQAEQMRPALQTLLKVPAGNLAELLAAPAPQVAADVLGHAQWAARSVEALATVSKAFSSHHAHCAPDWEEALAVVARILERFAGHVGLGGLWRAALFLCRRMVEVLGDQFIAVLDTLLPLLYGIEDRTDLAELTIFAHHLVCQYQQRVARTLRTWMGRLLFRRPYEVWCQMPEDSDQLRREKSELGCSLLQLLRETAQRCPAVLLETLLMKQGIAEGGVDAELGRTVAAFLLVGVSDPGELRALFLAAAAWSALLTAVQAEAAVAQEAAVVLPIPDLLMKLLWSVARMDCRDAQTSKIFAEVSSILRALLSCRLLPHGHPRKQMILDSLQQALISALPGLPSDLAPRALCEALSQDAPAREVSGALQRCALEWQACQPRAA